MRLAMNCKEWKEEERTLIKVHVHQAFQNKHTSSKQTENSIAKERKIDPYISVQALSKSQIHIKKTQHITNQWWDYRG